MFYLSARNTEAKGKIMIETEYTSPNGVRWMVSEVSGPVDVPNVNGTPNPLPFRNITCRRWIKSRNAFAKTSNQIGTRNWVEWTKTGHADHGHLNQYDEDTCEALKD